MTTAFQTNLSWFTGLYGSNPSATTRIHQVEWQGWVDGAKVAANFGIGLDTSFYTWGLPVSYPDGHQAHGYINGSGQPMRFVDQNGVVVPVYQQVTSLIDEALVTTDFSEHLTPAAATAVSQQIIDNSQAGDYAAVAAQFHVDYFGFSDVNAWATGTMNYARSLGIPMWTAERWLNYTTQPTRNGDHRSGLVVGGPATVLLGGRSCRQRDAEPRIAAALRRLRADQRHHGRCRSDGRPTTDRRTSNGVFQHRGWHT